jgi:hypothetical protein
MVPPTDAARCADTSTDQARGQREIVKRFRGLGDGRAGVTQCNKNNKSNALSGNTGQQ